MLCGSSQRHAVGPVTQRHDCCQLRALGACHRRHRKVRHVSCASGKREERSSDSIPPDGSRARKPHPLQARLTEYSKHLDGLLGNLAPKQEGDAMDIVLMCASTGVFVYLAMQMYRLYAFAYYHAEAHRQLLDLMS